jgi:hypothetical protein
MKLNVPLTAKLKHAGNRTRQLRNDTGEDNQGNTVSDSACGNLLAQPHQKYVPPTMVMTVEMRKNNPGSITAATG